MRNHCEAGVLIFMENKICPKCNASMYFYAKMCRPCSDKNRPNPWNKGTKRICKPNSGSFRKGKSHIWNPKHNIPMECKQCGKVIHINKYRLKSRKYCSKYCHSQSQKLLIGEKSYYYKHGMRHTRFYKIWGGIKSRCLD